MKIYYTYYSNVIIFFYTANSNLIKFLDEVYFRYIVTNLGVAVEIMSNCIECRSQYRIVFQEQEMFIVKEKKSCMNRYINILTTTVSGFVMKCATYINSHYS